MSIGFHTNIRLPTLLRNKSHTLIDNIFTNNLFKVSVNVVNAETFNNPDVWPVGKCVRRWRSFDKQT